MSHENLSREPNFTISTPEQIREVISKVLALSETNSELCDSLHAAIKRKVADLISLFGNDVRQSPLYHALVGSSQKLSVESSISNTTLNDINEAIQSFVNRDILPNIDSRHRLQETAFVSYFKNQITTLSDVDKNAIYTSMNEYLVELQQEYQGVRLREIPEAAFFIGGGDLFVGAIDKDLVREISDKIYDKFSQLLNLIYHSQHLVNTDRV